MQTARHNTEFKITPSVRKELVKIIDDRIKDVHVTKEDFSELKAIVKEIGVTVGELGQAQKRTELRMEELAEAQKRTESRVEELAVAQKRTEVEIQTLVRGLDRTNSELNGLSRSVSYALENEAYSKLPAVLKKHYGIVVTKKMIRCELHGEEINLFAKGKQDGRDILIVGEAGLKLGSVNRFKQLDRKVKSVKLQHPDAEIVKLLITHFATNSFMEQAKKRGVIVVQSFEW